jgi:LPXTG-motif cell wall-anchored protein
MDTKRSVLAIVLAAVLVFSMVSMASAFSQTWYLLNDITDKPTGADYIMTKGSGSSADHVREITAGSSKIWASRYPVSGSTIDMGATWTGNIRIYPKSGGSPTIKARVDIGIISGETFTPKFYDEQTWTKPGQLHFDWPISLAQDPFNIADGEYLAVKFTNDATSTTTVNVLCKPVPGPNSPSYIIYPFDNPVYPVPELSTILLTSTGLLMLGGFVVYSRRRKNN